MPDGNSLQELLHHEFAQRLLSMAWFRMESFSLLWIRPGKTRARKIHFCAMRKAVGSILSR